MRKDYINVLIKKPGLPTHFATVRNELPYLQAVVGGEEFTDFPMTLEGARQTLANLWEVS